MAIHGKIKQRIEILMNEYRALLPGKESLVQIIREVEISENVFNSNAIENSTLTLDETEQILLELSVSRQVSVREVYEAKNLARVINYLTSDKTDRKINRDIILFLHNMLISGINDDIAGRFRDIGEFVRVGKYIAPAPEHVESMIRNSIEEFYKQDSRYILDKIATFHLDFETIHPFCDGNGRMGRVLINYQLMQAGYPEIIIRDIEKQEYYRSFKLYQVGDKTETKNMENIIARGVLESLHKRIAYLTSKQIIRLSVYIKQNNLSPAGTTNAAKRQTIPAFREKGVWKIGVEYKK